MDLIAKQINDAILRVFTSEVHIVVGQHVQREGTSGVLRFLPGKSKATLAADIGIFIEHFVNCCRGVEFNVRVKETNNGGVEINILSSTNSSVGRKFVERG